MTFLETTIKDAKDKLADGKLRDCMEFLKNSLSANSDNHDVFVLLFSRYNKLKEQETLYGENIKVDENKLSAFLLEIINKLKEQDVSEGNFIETILIICSKQKRQDMEILFGKKYFPNRSFINYGEPIPAGVFDIIFLEDENDIINQKIKEGENKEKPTAESKIRLGEMKGCIEANAKQYFIYFGGRFPSGYENQVYYTNSRFSIYARLKEMLDYKKYYGH